MAKYIDLTGQKFGRLTVIEKDLIKTDNYVRWICKCDCGNIKSVRGSDLRRGSTQSCGCLRKIAAQNRPNNCKDLTGKKFGRLTVIGRNYEMNKITGRHDSYWDCQCECGNITTKITFELKTIKSCGHCIEYEHIGQRFGNLVIEKYLGKFKNGNLQYATASRFLCKCDCGNYINVTWAHLQSGHTTSCGCSKRSMGEQIINRILTENNIPFIREYTFSDLKSDKGNRLRFDFAILNTDNNVIRLIEFDGPQHEGDISSRFSENYEDLHKRDILKNKYCIEHNIPLVRIPYEMKIKITLDMLLNNNDFLVKE